MATTVSREIAAAIGAVGLLRAMIGPATSASSRARTARRDAVRLPGCRETLLVVVPSRYLTIVRFGPAPKPPPWFRGGRGAA